MTVSPVRDHVDDHASDGLLGGQVLLLANAIGNVDHGTWLCRQDSSVRALNQARALQLREIAPDRRTVDVEMTGQCSGVDVAGVLDALQQRPPPVR